MLKQLTAWLLPYTCVLCGLRSNRDQDLCEDCYQELPFTRNACYCCAVELPSSATGTIHAHEVNAVVPRLDQEHLPANTLLCGQCLRKKPYFDRTCSVFVYDQPIDRLLLELKFTQVLMNARILGELMAEKLCAWYQDQPLPTAILPIPLHPLRLKERGYNQAIELARPIAKALHLPIDTSSCVRSKATLPQAQLPSKHRADNVSHAFKTDNDFSGEHLAVIDDVITTGNTMNAFCKMLKQHGAKTIDVWCCARPKPF